MAKKRKFRPLIQVEGGGVMLLAKAKALVAIGRGFIVSGVFKRYDPTDSGYDRAAGVHRWAGKPSDGYQVMQARGRVYSR